MDMLDHTYRLLDQRRESLRDIAEGSGVNYHWLAKFNQRLFSDPGHKKLQRLYEYLAATNKEAA